MKHYALLIPAVLLGTYLILGQSFESARAQTVDAAVAPSQGEQETNHTITLGDTWEALSWRFDTAPQDLIAANGAINRQRQPAIGSAIFIPDSTPRKGHLIRPFTGGALELAARYGRNPWTIALQNDLAHPYSPLLYRQLFLPGGRQPPRELPPGLEELALAPAPIAPGTALALRARAGGETPPRFSLENEPLIVTQQPGHTFIALGATGAFYAAGQHLLNIRVGDNPLWEQPLTFSDRDWTWEQVTFNNTAVLDPEAIRLERERLQELWDEVAPEAMWQGGFIPPIDDFVEISSLYGARRSVNDGPYSSYHEGTDFSAYRGSEVTAPAAGQVVLAEELAIRGGAVILDHGLGLHSGYYHLSAIHVTPGQYVEASDLLGEVGSTGRSTGNHLHWDLLVGRTWIDPLSWLEQGLDAWLSPAPPPSPTAPGPIE